MAISGNDTAQIECTVEHSTAKAWLVEDNMSGEKAWLPKSIATMDSDADPDGNILFTVPMWWLKKNNFV